MPGSGLRGRDSKCLILEAVAESGNQPGSRGFRCCQDLLPFSEPSDQRMGTGNLGCCVFLTIRLGGFHGVQTCSKFGNSLKCPPPPYPKLSFFFSKSEKTSSLSVLIFLSVWKNWLI